ncbi:MAG: hypothetical protein Q4F24_11445 [Eubacteriales bacterium]|nr:hypothetical protein [Eubacteriales bacterium]
MIAKREIKDTKIYQELDAETQKYWFDFKKSKFLHNIDTFYYSVKFKNDFTEGTIDKNVLAFRSFLKKRQDELLASYGNMISFYLEDLGNLNMLPLRFSGFYNICFEKPEEFHIFIAPKVPKSQKGDSVTCEMIVQIRSYMLWMYGVHNSFQRSYEYVKAIADMFHLDIDFVQENRVDYCWHSNYLSNPEQFFNIENFYKMRVDRFKGAHFNTEKVGSEDYLIDYIALGKRGQKCFVRIYLKSKEVVEMGYKPFFFRVWLFHGLINRYDLYCYEECFKRGNWGYLDIARLQYYVEYGQDKFYREMAADIVYKNEYQLNVTDKVRKLADQLTPRVNLVVNVEFQTMRKASKSYPLIPFKDNSDKKECKRIYDYFDNHYMIANYLTKNILRLVEPNGDSNKSRRDDCGFWKALRRTKMVDVLVPKADLPFIRQYNRRISSEVMKRQLVNKAVMLGFYNKGINNDSPAQDAMDSIMTLNDNDIKRAMRYKDKKSRQLSQTELSGLRDDFSCLDYTLVDNETGVVYSHDSIESFFLQCDD